MILSEDARATVERAARAARPHEYCAALLGTGATVTDVVRLRNCDPRPGRFAVPDAELRRAHEVAHQRGRNVLALLHSHPFGPARPSAADLRSTALSPYPWVIVAFDAQAAFVIGDALDELQPRQNRRRQELSLIDPLDRS